MASKRCKQKKEGRIHLRVTSYINKSIREYALRHHTDLTSIVTKHFLELLESEKNHKFPEVEQI
jgi:hypothetical protein